MNLHRIIALTCVAVSVLTFAACGDDDGGGEVTPLATTGPDYVATANARLQNCPGQRAPCIQGADAEVAFAPPSDVGVITRAGHYQEYTCLDPATSEGFDPLAAICASEAPGAVVEGLPVGRLQSEGFVVDRPGFRAFLETWLAEIVAPPAFTALGCPIDAARDAPVCDDAYVLVYTGPVTNGVGEVLLLAIDRVDGQLGVTTALTGIFDTGDPGFNKDLVLGGDVEWFPARSGQTPTRYQAISPPGG